MPAYKTLPASPLTLDLRPGRQLRPGLRNELLESCPWKATSLMSNIPGLACRFVWARRHFCRSRPPLTVSSLRWHSAGSLGPGSLTDPWSLQSRFANQPSADHRWTVLITTARGGPTSDLA